jgi:hypothetical protein
MVRHAGAGWIEAGGPPRLLGYSPFANAVDPIFDAGRSRIWPSLTGWSSRWRETAMSI